MNPSTGQLYVARYDFTDVAKEGIITVLNENGDVENELMLPGCPEITGLYFSKTQNDILYATETSNNSLLKILVSQ